LRRLPVPRTTTNNNAAANSNIHLATGAVTYSLLAGNNNNNSSVHFHNSNSNINTNDNSILSQDSPFFVKPFASTLQGGTAASLNMPSTTSDSATSTSSNVATSAAAAAAMDPSLHLPGIAFYSMMGDDMNHMKRCRRYCFVYNSSTAVSLTGPVARMSHGN
jgi:hypothetical protein